VLSDVYNGNVTISGACAVPVGPAVVNGNLTGLINGDVKMGHGATLILGCLPSSSASTDDPSGSRAGSISGNLKADEPLGVIVHDSTIGGNVEEEGGGGGVSCPFIPPNTPLPAGSIFAALGAPVYRDYEDSSIGGDLKVTGLHSCWLGRAPVTVHATAARKPLG